MTKTIPNYFCICRTLKDKDIIRHYGTGNCSLVACTALGKPVAELQSYDSKECVRFIRKHIAANQIIWLTTNLNGLHYKLGFVWGTQLGKKPFVTHYNK